MSLNSAWSDRVRLNTDVNYDYVDVTFASDKAFGSLCIWAYGLNGSILTGNYNVTVAGGSVASGAAERKITVTDVNGNAVSAFAANTVYKVRIYLNDDASAVALSTFDTKADDPSTFYFGAVSYGNDPVSNER